MNPFLVRKVNRLSRQGAWDSVWKLFDRQKNREARKRIVIALGDTGLPGAAEVLVGRMRDESPDIRAEAVAALERIGWSPTEADENAIQFHLLKENWGACGELFLKNPDMLSCGGLLNYRSLPLETRRLLLGKLEIKRETAWQEAFESLYYGYWTAPKSDPQYQLYPEVILAWSRTGDGRSAQYLAHIATSFSGGNFRQRAFDAVVGLGAAAIPSLITATLYEDLESTAESMIVSIGEAALPALRDERAKKEAGSAQIGQIDGLIERIEGKGRAG